MPGGGVLERLREDLARLRGDTASPPDASVVVPVNAQADLENVLNLLTDITRYQGSHSFEIVLVINNYPEDARPAELESYARSGMHIVGIPSAWRAGEVVSFTARVPGARAAASERLIHLDADCRIPNPSLLFDWYIDQFDRGAHAAYTHVDYYDLRPLWSVRARIVVHHLARWVKRVFLRIPTIRGSNYAVDRSVFLRLYEQGLLVDDLNVGPAVKAAGERVAYSRVRSLRVLTSGRKFRGGWRKLARYLRYRLLYNVRVLRTGDRKGGETYHHKPLR
jgi:glycosyltransferase involved in cell wall biosynthesis